MGVGVLGLPRPRYATVLREDVRLHQVTIGVSCLAGWDPLGTTCRLPSPVPSSELGVPTRDGSPPHFGWARHNYSKWGLR